MGLRFCPLDNAKFVLQADNAPSSQIINVIDGADNIANGIDEASSLLWDLFTHLMQQ